MAITTPAALAAEFATMAAQAEPRARAAVVKTLADIAADAKTLVPRDTGFLANSITFEMTGPLSGEVGPEAHYGGYVEQGTSRMAPQPYMTPAAERNAPMFEDAIDQLAGFGPTMTVVNPGRL